MKNLENKTAVITGAASGIGRHLAFNLATEGCALALSDTDYTGLLETASMIDDLATRITTHKVDAGNRDQTYGFAADVMSEHGAVDIVINNAGTGIAGRLEEVSFEEFSWLMNTNFWGVVNGSLAFLPFLRRQNEAHIVNISSVHGLFTNPGVGPYCSSKFAVRGFTMALAQELRETTVRVSCVHPGGIRTNIVRNARIAERSTPDMTSEEAQAHFDQTLGRTSAKKAARIIIKGIKKNKARILVGRDAYVFDLGARFFPNTWQRLMGRLPDWLAKRAARQK